MPLKKVATMKDAGRSQPPLRISTSKAPRKSGGADDAWPAVAPEEPVSPTARIMDGIYIVVTMGLGVPLNLAAFRAGIASQLARYPRFQSIQVTRHGGKPHWVLAPAVNLDDHIIVVPTWPDVALDPDRAVEDYVASLSTDTAAPMDRSRPLWEFHFLDFPTSEAASTVVLRVNHSLADGMSLMTLLMASMRSAADPSRLPVMPAPPARSGPIYARPRPPLSVGGWPALASWVWSLVVLGWHTVVDLALFIAIIMFARDPHTLFKRADNESPRRRRFVNQSLRLDDVKFLKEAMNCTVNDVLVGVTSAALSRYYFRRSGDTTTRKICLRSVLLVNQRPPTSLQAYVDMIESGNSNQVKWGNQLGYIILPFHIAMYEDPLEYVREAKKVVDRKKRSLEVVFTRMLGEVVLKTLGIKAAAIIFHRMLAHTTISFSNMIGPAEHVEFYGHPVVSIAPSVYGPPGALTVHYQSYGNTIKVILGVDEEHFPDHGQLLDDFTEALQIIKDGASRK